MSMTYLSTTDALSQAVADRLHDLDQAASSAGARPVRRRSGQWLARLTPARG